MSYLDPTLVSMQRAFGRLSALETSMQQAALDLVLQPTLAAADPAPNQVDSTGFDIGWDHAHHGLVPPAGLLLAGTPVCQGWMAGKAVFGGRVLAATRSVRLCLQLRTLAWRQGVAFDTLQVTPNHLSQIHSARCPVLRQTLGGAPGEALTAVVQRLNPKAGFAAGNLAMLSHAAAQALSSVDVAQAVRHARRAERDNAAVAGLDATGWWRVATLRSFATPLPFFEAACLPLAVLPPNRVRLLNSAQGLQALVTLQFTTPGWSTRARTLAAMLPAHTLRHDFNLFIGALAPRVLEAGPDPQALRRALEDAWLLERVQRRWQQFVLSLGEVATEALLQRAAAAGLAGVRTQCLPTERATEGWALDTAGRVGAVAASAAGQPRATNASAPSNRHFAPRQAAPLLAAALS
jgi:hypothetical protein